MSELPESVAGSAAPIARTYLPWALAATVLCFLPLGLVALYYGLRVNAAVGDGRLDVAVRCSRIARRWLIATVVIGVLIYLLLAAVFALLGAFSN